ncbi:hypothetical protein JAAARDRAFT_201341 [Jaapia argillacea MUCL 33604]|uniref:Uncharacterized protein n=1 Tax=Jaapia argillacea MUCL 33604 TaxID=933084 RepID=A0A067P4Y0_9AGAM|nr:hypothetical protein JAAARDRAFT_201341 [Jaapia argillacea MUCL 33604]
MPITFQQVTNRYKLQIDSQLAKPAQAHRIDFPPLAASKTIRNQQFSSILTLIQFERYSDDTANSRASIFAVCIVFPNLSIDLQLAVIVSNTFS